MNISRRALAAGAGAAVLVSNAPEAAEKDPHIAWLDEVMRLHEEADRLAGKACQIEQAIPRPEITTTVGRPRLRWEDPSASEGGLRPLLPDTSHTVTFKSLAEIRACKEHISFADYQRVEVEWFEAESRYDDLVAGSDAPTLECRADELVDKAYDIMLKIASTPANTLEGFAAQVAVMIPFDVGLTDAAIETLRSSLPAMPNPHAPRNRAG